MVTIIAVIFNHDLCIKYYIDLTYEIVLKFEITLRVIDHSNPVHTWIKLNTLSFFMNVFFFTFNVYVNLK